MNWKKEQLGAFFRIKHGFAFKGEFFSDKGEFVLLTPGNFHAFGGIKLKGEKEKYYAGYFPEDYLLKKGDLLVAMTDLTQDAPILGAPAIIPSSGRFLHNQRLGRIVDLQEQELDQHFLFYLLNDPKVRAQVKATATGATVRHTAPERIYAIQVQIPPLPTQQKIAAILSTYDDLIENNSRRIQLLRSQAKLLFDHYEKLSLSTSIKRTLGEISDEVGGTIRTGPFGSQLHESDYTEQGIPVVMPKNIIDGRVRAEGIARIPEEIAARLSQHALGIGDIVYGRRGDIGRRGFISKSQKGWLCGTGCLRISLQGSVLNPRYLYEYLGKPDVIEMIAGRAIGATMPNLNTSILRDIPIMTPPYALQKTFADQVEPIDGLLENLEARNSKLRQTRDLLLPKLISGEVDVSALDINTAALAG